MYDNANSSQIATSNYLNNSFYEQSSDIDASLLRTENKMSGFRHERLMSKQRSKPNQNSSGNLWKNKLFPV